MEKDTQTLAQWLRQAMDERGLSLRALHLYSGVARTTTEGILQGIQPKPATIAKLAAYFEVDPNYLWELAQRRPSPFQIESVDLADQINRAKMSIAKKWGTSLTPELEEAIAEAVLFTARDKAGVESESQGLGARRQSEGRA